MLNGLMLSFKMDGEHLFDFVKTNLIASIYFDYYSNQSLIRRISVNLMHFVYLFKKNRLVVNGSYKGAGELGKPVILGHLSPEEEDKVNEGYEKNAFNQYISDMISLHRTLPDVRHAEYAHSYYYSQLDDVVILNS